jgi:23S rRNA pseudouridine2605 synthase
MTDEPEDLQPKSSEPEFDTVPAPKIEDPIGNETDGEAEAAIEPETDTETQAQIEAFESEGGLEPASEDSPEREAEPEAEPEFNPKPRPPAKLERLQKILAQAGVASRRKAEEMIEQGRIQVNGKVVTELGTKADATRDHIRVDGKLLQGAERLRYFVLNKPKGFVTTVKDPEGRPTVMQFFDKMRERLYPVGRLDYMSEGLLLVTNDGDLANRLTRAASGVEKTYLVKVAGQPTEADLDILRGGVSIERGKTGEGRVRTSPARIRQVRQGDNPWYEVVLIEGRNRELRKMFEEIGHFVEKIRRVGYGPLVLDQEPGNLRELQPDELIALRQAAEGKLRTPKSKEVRRRNAADAAQLPTVAPRASRPRPAKPPFPKPFAPKPFEERSPDRGPARGPARADDRPRRSGTTGPAKYGPAQPTSRSSAGPFKRPFRREEGEGSTGPRPTRPAWKKDDRPTRPPSRFAAGSNGEDRPRPNSAGPGRTGGGRPFTAKPSWKKPERQEWPAYKRPPAPRREAPDEDSTPPRPPNLRIEEIQQSDRPSTSRPSAPRSYPDRPKPARSGSDRPRPSQPSPDRTASSRPSSSRPFNSEGGLPRAFTTSSGKPRPGGARPSSKPGKPAGRSFSPGASPRSGSGSRSIDPRTGSGYRPSPGGRRSIDGPPTGSRPSRPYTPRPEGASGSTLPRTKKFSGSSSRGTGPRSESPRGESSPHERKTGTGWKPKTRYGGSGKSVSSARSKPRPGSSAKPSHKNKPGGKKRG